MSLESTESQQELAEVLATCASFNLRKASRIVSQAFDESLSGTGLKSTQITVLLVLAVNGPLQMSDLADELVLTPSTLSRNLKPLVRDGFIKLTRAVPRGKIAQITELGLTTVETAKPMWLTAQTQFLDQIGEDNWAQLRPQLGNVVNNLKP